MLIEIACCTSWNLADLKHDSLVVEEVFGRFPELLSAVVPLRTVGDIPHDRRAIEDDGLVVCPAGVILSGAVVCDLRAIIDFQFVSDQSYRFMHPIPDSRGVVAVRLIASIRVETACQMEKASIGGAILVIIPGVPLIDLPSKATAAMLRVPATPLNVEDALSQSQPLRLTRRRVVKVQFRCGHNRISPKRLVVVPFVLALVARHIVVVRPGLEEKALLNNIIVGRVAGVIPIIYQSVEHGATLPPVVRLSKQTGGLAGFIPVIVLHHAIGYGARGGFGGLRVVDDQFDSQNQLRQSQRRGCSLSKEAHSGRRNPTAREVNGRVR